jgi:hypothetical protein
MDDMTHRGRDERIRAVMEELGANEETAEFAVALTDGETRGCVRAITFPLPGAEARRQAAILVEHLGFTPDEAARYVAGDRSAIEAVAARRRVAEEGDPTNLNPVSRASALTAD